MNHLVKCMVRFFHSAEKNDVFYEHLHAMYQQLRNAHLVDERAVFTFVPYPTG